MSQYYSESQVLGKGTYENWFKIEKAIRKYDRWFNKIEKFPDIMNLTGGIQCESSGFVFLRGADKTIGDILDIVKAGNT